MKTRVIIIIMAVSLGSSLSAVGHENRHHSVMVNDGPYFFLKDNTLKAYWIKNEVLKETVVTRENFNELSKQLNLRFSYSDLLEDFSLNSNASQAYRNIDSVGVIADLHGEFHTYKKLLKAMGFIDKDLNWSFGKGHLVVLGDIMDRGDMVTEILWHLFMLEKQAAEAGGKVHVLLGNHELMVFSDDLRYINEKYRRVEEIIDTSYTYLYSGSSVLGNWLRSKPVVITINDVLFTHGGLSVELVRKEIRVRQINRIYSDLLTGRMLRETDLVNAEFLLESENDPLWYRGYFRDPSFCENRLDSILDFYKVGKIVVGHTSFDVMKPLFNNRIIGVDAGIMNNESGEMLIYSQGAFYRGLHNGKRLKLEEIAD